MLHSLTTSYSLAGLVLTTFISSSRNSQRQPKKAATFFDWYWFLSSAQKMLLTEKYFIVCREKFLACRDNFFAGKGNCVQFFPRDIAEYLSLTPRATAFTCKKTCPIYPSFHLLLNNSCSSVMTQSHWPFWGFFNLKIDQQIPKNYRFHWKIQSKWIYVPFVGCYFFQLLLRLAGTFFNCLFSIATFFVNCWFSITACLLAEIGKKIVNFS